MKKIVFVCKGNMHRSVVAMALYNVLKRDDSFASSCGTMVEAEGRTGRTEESYPSLWVFIDALKKLYGVDISNHVCTQVTPKVLEGANKIVVMAEEEFIPNWLRKYNYIKWALPDPDHMTEDEAVKDIRGIKDKVESLL